MARLDRFLRGTASFLFLSCLLDFSLVEFRTSIPDASPRNKERKMSADLSRSLSDPCTSVWRQWKCEEVRTGHPATQWRPNHSVRTAVNYSSSVYVICRGVSNPWTADSTGPRRLLECPRASRENVLKPHYTKTSFLLTDVFRYSWKWLYLFYLIRVMIVDAFPFWQAVDIWVV